MIDKPATLLASFVDPMLRKRAVVLGALLSCSWLTGCGPDSLGALSFDTNGQAIVEGEPATDFESVVRISGGGSCTATLVAPNLLLTAMHCVAPLAVDGGFECKYNGDIVYTTPNGGALSAVISPSKVAVTIGVEPGDKVAHGKTIITTNSDHICHNDLALILLDQELDLPLMPLRLDNDTLAGEKLTIVGYGMTEVSGAEVQRRMRENISIIDVGGEPGSTVRSSAPPRTLTVGKSACPGDSGGPAIGNKHGEAVVGVSSIVLNDCLTDSALNIYTRIAPFKSLILSAFKEAGYEPWFEGEDGPGIPDPPAATTAVPTPSATEEPPPAPDAGTDEDEDTTPRQRRLKSGCSLDGGFASPASSSSRFAALACMGWLALVAARRRRRGI